MIVKFTYILAGRIELNCRTAIHGNSDVDWIEVDYLGRPFPIDCIIYDEGSGYQDLYAILADHARTFAYISRMNNNGHVYHPHKRTGRNLADHGAGRTPPRR